MHNDEKISKVIGRKIEKIKNKITELSIKRRELQDICPHYGLIKTPGANTGNWDRNDDEYWTDYKCPHCGKQWREMYGGKL